MVVIGFGQNFELSAGSQNVVDGCLNFLEFGQETQEYVLEHQPSRMCANVKSSEFRRVCYRINILDSQLSPSSINLVPAQAGKVTVGLASHWPCITDTVVYPPTGSTAKDREMSTYAYRAWHHLPLPCGISTLCVNKSM